jgi:membrane-bound lytic murein transglycosylase D
MQSTNRLTMSNKPAFLSAPLLILWFVAGFFTSAVSASALFPPPGTPEPQLAAGLAPPPLALITDDLLTRIGSHTQLPTAENERVQRQITFFLAGPRALRATLRRAEPFLFNIVTELERAGLPTGLAMLPAIESAFDPLAVSPMQAAGLWQFIPETGDRYGITRNRQYDGRFSPLDSTRAAVKFLTALGDHYDGDWLLALAAYNTGPGNVDRAIAKARRNAQPINYWNLSLPRETMDYVPRLLALLTIISQPERFNITLPHIANQPSLLGIDLKQRFSLSMIAEHTGLAIAELRRLNPAIKADSSPERGPHRLLLPARQARALHRIVQDDPKRTWHNVPAVHVVVSGDSLSELARTYETSVERLQALNNLKDSKIGIGRKLTVGVAPAQSRGNQEPLNTGCHSHERHLDYRYATHTVQSGDSIWSIARTLDTQSANLRDWNDINADQQVLSIGELMHHASLTKRAAQAPQVIRYRTRNGDTLPGIASKFAVTSLALRRCNASLQKGVRLRPGQLVLIPLRPS